MSDHAPAGMSGFRHDKSAAGARGRRTAPWWLLPATVVVVLGGFSIYAFWTAVFGGFSEAGPYLSPFFSPVIWRGGPLSSAIWVLPVPLAFRATCYYYRKAYYRSFFWDPPACAIGELRHREYRGETRFPMVLNNLHRFAMYLATLVLAFLWIDVLAAFRYQSHWYVGLGTVLMLVNVVLLSGYSFSCHSLRHLVGGGLDCYTGSRAGSLRFRLWRAVTTLNERHPMYAWLSLFSVLAVDIYIRLMQHGLVDPHLTF